MAFIFSTSPSSKLSESFIVNNISINNESTVSARVENIVPTVVEPVDYENYYRSNCCGHSGIENESDLEFPNGSDDVDVYVLPRKVRTISPAGPEEDM